MSTLSSINTNIMACNTAINLNEHYGRLSISVKRLSSGLRINSAADDAAGLAIRELMRSDVAALNQGMRNANDAISMIQVADGALAIIDEKLIRMKELAEQAATGTYNSTQRLMIHSEFVAMGEEIDRIARATDFNGIKLLDGSLSGQHNGKGLNATGAIKIHFGTSNDSAEDYYYVEIGDCTLAGLGLRDEAVTTINAGGIKNTSAVDGAKADPYGGVPILSDVVKQGTINFISKPISFSYYTLGIIPAGTTSFSLWLRDEGRNDTIQVFTRSGQHIAGTTLDKWTDSPPFDTTGTIATPGDFIKESNGFLPNAIYDNTSLNGHFHGNIPVDYTDPSIQNTSFTINGMNINYSGDKGDQYWPAPTFGEEQLNIDNVTEDLIIIIAGYDTCQINPDWTYMPTATNPPQPPDPPNPPNPPGPDVPTPDLPQGDIISIRTQNEAQQALGRIDDAIVKKDKVRAHLGAMQNRLENTVTNIAIQAENLMASESRISDVDIATEMSVFVRNQILTQSAVAMLGQANSYPHMLGGLLQG